MKYFKNNSQPTMRHIQDICKNTGYKTFIVRKWFHQKRRQQRSAPIPNKRFGTANDILYPFYKANPYASSEDMRNISKETRFKFATVRWWFYGQRKKDKLPNKLNAGEKNINRGDPMSDTESDEGKSLSLDQRILQHYSSDNDPCNEDILKISRKAGLHHNKVRRFFRQRKNEEINQEKKNLNVGSAKSRLNSDNNKDLDKGSRNQTRPKQSSEGFIEVQNLKSGRRRVSTSSVEKRLKTNNQNDLNTSLNDVQMYSLKPCVVNLQTLDDELPKSTQEKLNKYHKNNPNPSGSELELLSKMMHVNVKQLRLWFKNKNASQEPNNIGKSRRSLPGASSNSESNSAALNNSKRDDSTENVSRHQSKDASNRGTKRRRGRRPKKSSAAKKRRVSTDSGNNNDLGFNDDSDNEGFEINGLENILQSTSDNVLNGTVTL